MDSLSVRQQNNPKIPIFHLWNLDPAPNSAVSLANFAYGRPNGPLNPLVLDDAAIGTLG
jgi:hypothetical protein